MYYSPMIVIKNLFNYILSYNTELFSDQLNTNSRIRNFAKNFCGYLFIFPVSWYNVSSENKNLWAHILLFSFSEYYSAVFTKIWLYFLRYKFVCKIFRLFTIIIIGFWQYLIKSVHILDVYITHKEINEKSDLSKF